ncbi:Cytochrome c2 [Roseivivax sp. THAF40]|uniref:c-type cytochrome n=1 Tax=unclassified Roseivivax TaxID=2639302 RepID=UPI0012688AC0|nr:MULTISPECIES: c-type cytochrome [unclassified Roseivivax]QFS83825.1 Cytochrome c2 [Roseivivax sp. THAF197b]QFT47657.1 Cytochrome c2 [Roseivivax sp. THAF40]
MSKSLKLFGGALGGAVVVLLGAVNFADRFVTEAPAPKPRVVAAQPAPSSPPAPEVAEAAAETAPESGGLLVAAANADEQSAATGKFGIGREALPEEVAAWDVNIMPDGTGLPEGSGSVADGEILFSDNCAACHGEFAEGVGNWPELAGGEGTLADKDPVKTVGSYWPYLSTAWDYVHRSMPFGNAQSLSADETYAIVAYILYSNWIVEDDFVLSKENFLEVEMPNADGFIVDDRAETEYAQWRSEPCMSDCKDAVEITMRATVLDVTPDEGGDEEAAMAEEETTATEAAPTETAAVAEEASAEETTMAALDPELVAAGEKVFRKCSACHKVGEGAKNGAGPQLNGIVGREVGGVDGFKYSSTMADHGGVWDEALLAAFLADPRGSMKGTRMAFAGLKKEADIDAVVAFLKSTESQ